MRALALAEMHLPRRGVYRGDLAAQAQVDVVPGVELGALQRYPAFIRGAGQVILRQVRTVAGRVRVGARHRQATAEAQLAQPLRRGESCRTAADDDDRTRIEIGRAHV